MDSNYEIVRELIEYNCDGVDKYIHNNSTWLIFTDDKKWVIELTKDGTLWYNYNFFKDVFKYLSLDVVENQHYITKWVENTIINEVRNTLIPNWVSQNDVEDTIKNGVKHIRHSKSEHDSRAENIIQNGVKQTSSHGFEQQNIVENIIQNGVKHTEKSLQIDGSCVVEDVIQNGIKETHDDVYHHKGRVDDVIKNGIKE